MTIAVGDTRFRGPYSRVDMLEHRPGVWAILDGRDTTPVAVGAAEDVRRAVKDHPSRPSWSRRCRRPAVAVFYAPLADQRDRVLRGLRSRFDLPRPAGGAALPHPRPPEAGAARATRRRSATPAGADAGGAAARAASESGRAAAAS